MCVCVCSCWSGSKCSWRHSWRTLSIKTSTLCTWRSSGRSEGSDLTQSLASEMNVCKRHACILSFVCVLHLHYSFVCICCFPPVVLPHLHKLALANNSQAVESKRIDIATQLFEAYSALSCCCILFIDHA